MRGKILHFSLSHWGVAVMPVFNASPVWKRDHAASSVWTVEQELPLSTKWVGEEVLTEVTCLLFYIMHEYVTVWKENLEICLLDQKWSLLRSGHVTLVLPFSLLFTIFVCLIASSTAHISSEHPSLGAQPCNGVPQVFGCCCAPVFPQSTKRLLLPSSLSHCFSFSLVLFTDFKWFW